jgi:hypothetical protein
VALADQSLPWSILWIAMLKSIDDYNASFEVLKANIGLYHSGVGSSYRVVATELRKLLCDRKALIPRLFKNFRPHKLHMTVAFEKFPEMLDSLLFTTPCSTQFDGKGGHRSFLNLAQPLQQMDLDLWLDQPFMSKKVTIREFIKSVADKEGAHSDPEFNDTLAFSHSVHLAADRSTGDNIVAIGEYVVAYLETGRFEFASPDIKRVELGNHQTPDAGPPESAAP